MFGAVTQTFIHITEINITVVKVFSLQRIVIQMLTELCNIWENYIQEILISLYGYATTINTENISMELQNAVWMLGYMQINKSPLNHMYLLEI